MKKSFCLLSLFLLISARAVFGQNTFFPTEKQAFYEQLSAYLGASTVKQERDEAATLMQGFRGVLDSYYSDNEIDKIVGLCELFHSKGGGKSYANIFNFVEVLQKVPTAGMSHSDVNNWLVFTELKANKRMVGIDKYLSSCRSVFVENVLSAKGNSKWMLRGALIGFPSAERPELTVDGSLVLASLKDESVIHDTKGVFNLDENRWEGMGGRADWSRFGIPSDRIYAIFPDYYVIDLSRSDYVIDSVRFVEKRFFDEPLLGQFEDKVLPNKPNEKTMYPRVSSYRSDYKIDNIFGGVDFSGGFGVMGNQIEVFGGKRNKASFVFRNGSKRVMRVESQRFLMTDEEILMSDHAALRLYLEDTVSGIMEGDSLYHNRLGFRFDNKDGKMMAYRSEKDFGDGPFHDQYHCMDLFFEAMYWERGSNLVDFMRMAGVNPTSEGSLVSTNFFRIGEFKKLQGIDGRHPMIRLEGFLNGFDNVEKQVRFAIGDLASYLSFPIEQVLSLVLRLQAEGLMEYDTDTKWVTVLPRYFDMLEAYRDNTDYDVIKLHSVTTGRQPNLRIDLNTNDMIVFGLTSQVEGVKDATIALSDRKQVVIVPDNKRIIIKKNRNFQFSGGILAGMFEFFTKDCLFNYKEFSIEMAKVDSLRFYAKADKQVVPVKGTLEKLQGKLLIDRGDNKSSRDETPEYPIFNSESPSFKFYRNINGGVFHPGPLDSVATADGLEGKFYYQLYPFVVDSLDDLSMRKVRFDGELVSGGIFPNIVEPLVVMDDYSLGFAHRIGGSDAASYPMFGDKGGFHQNVYLSENGFFGSGQLDYQSAKFQSEHFVFYLDSVTGITNHFEMVPRSDGTLFPNATGSALKLKWDVGKPELTFETFDQAICMYGDTYFSGKSRLTPEGYAADGKLRFGLTEFDSDHFAFDASTFVADSANFLLYSSDSKTIAFSASNYRANVDFDGKKVKYDYLDDNSTLDFPMNRFVCSLKEAEWDMASNSLHVYNPVESFGDYATATTHEELLAIHNDASKFISLVPEQDSLQFYSMSADYDMTNYVIHAHDVKIIRVADAAVFPYEQDVDINTESKLEPVRGELLADTLNRHHLYKDAVVNIHSSRHYDAQGIWDYTDLEGSSTPVWVENIAPIEGVTHGHAQIADTAGFKLSTQFGFNGQLTLKATEKHGLFEGDFALLAFEEAMSSPSDTTMIQADSVALEVEEEEPHEPVAEVPQLPKDTLEALNHWFASSAYINPADIKIPVDMECIQKQDPKMCNGLYYELAIDGGFFAAFLTPKDKRPEALDGVERLNGLLWFDADSMRFVVTDTSRFDTHIVLDQRGRIEGKSTMDFGFDLGLTRFAFHGKYEQYPNDSLTINGLSILNAPLMDDKVLAAIAEVYAGMGGNSIDLTQTQYIHYFQSENDKTLTEERHKAIELEGYPKMASGDFYDNTIVIPDLKMVWNNQLRAFVSVGKIGLGNLGGHVVNKYVDGFVMFDRRLGNIAYYFQNDMFQTYINYNCGDGQLQIHATYGDINQKLYDTKEKARSVSKDGKSFQYVAVPYESMIDFLNRLKNAGIE